MILIDHPYITGYNIRLQITTRCPWQHDHLHDWWAIATDPWRHLPYTCNSCERSGLEDSATHQRRGGWHNAAKGRHDTLLCCHLSCGSSLVYCRWIFSINYLPVFKLLTKLRYIYIIYTYTYTYTYTYIYNIYVDFYCSLLKNLYKQF